MTKENTCCFTGHRKIAPAQQMVVAERLRDTVEKLICGGFTEFLAGGALGFDTMAAQCVLSLKEKYPHIRLVLALPCVTQTKGWSAEDVLVYENIKQQADEVVYTSQEYTRGCMFKRNRYLVDHSSVCVTYLTGNKGGTAYTVAYAHQKGLNVINLGAQ